MVTVRGRAQDRTRGPWDDWSAAILLPPVRPDAAAVEAGTSYRPAYYESGLLSWGVLGPGNFKVLDDVTG